jgi:hypothetical protein
VLYLGTDPSPLAQDDHQEVLKKPALSKSKRPLLIAKKILPCFANHPQAVVGIKVGGAI